MRSTSGLSIYFLMAALIALPSCAIKMNIDGSDRTAGGDSESELDSASGESNETEDHALSVSLSSPSSPSNSSTTPDIKGTAGADVSSVRLYSDAGCSTLIGSGLVSDFMGTGIEISVSANTTTAIYAKSLNSEGVAFECTAMGFSYTHDSNAPAGPSFTSTTPATPTNSTTTVAVKGTIPGDASSVILYSDSGCTAQMNTGSGATFSGAGVSVTMTANNTTTVYAKSVDAAGNASACTHMVNFVHDNTGPADPAYTSTNPSSPSNSSTSPLVIGTTSADTVTVSLFSNAGCTTQIGTGTKADFTGSGITATVSANASTSIYARAYDSLSNGSNCVMLTTYTHDNTAPAGPTFVSTSPASPSASDTSPEVIGSATADTVTVTLYSDAACSSQIGTGSKATFEGAGITASASANASTTIYAIAEDSLGNASACTNMTTYLHDNTAPADPTFSSTNPGSPNNTSTTPAVIGGASADTATVKIYSDAACSTEIGSGTRAQFVGAGISSTVSSNATTSLYGKAFDALNNASSCVSFASYTHDSNAPANPAFVSTNASSPSNADTSPEVIGTAPADAVTVALFSDAACSASLASGTKAQFEGAGLSISVTANTSTAIYGIAYDAAGNPSSCTSLTTYVHDNVAPADPTFSSTNPSSPNNTSTTPAVIGASDAGTSTITLYSDASCTTSIGSGSKASFEGAGITATAGSNTTTAIYAKATDAAGNNSGCASMLSYVHDTSGPADPVFVSTSPSSPNNSSTTPAVIGTSSADTVTVRVYSDAACSTEIGSDTKANFEGAGATATVGANATTSIYGKAFDTVGNGSACVSFTSYTHDNTAPTNPTFSSTSPASPSKTDSAPEVIGSSSADTVTVKIYSDASCSTEVGSGTKAAFEGAGITATVGTNASTTLYAKSFDSLSNGSSCTSMSTYIHDSTAPTNIATLTLSPSVSNSTTQSPSASWSASSDALSGLNGYEYSIGTSSGGTQVVSWTANATTSKTVTGLTLSQTTYYFNVRALDAAGNTSAVKTTSWTVDTTAPTPDFTAPVHRDSITAEAASLFKGECEDGIDVTINVISGNDAGASYAEACSGGVFQFTMDTTRDAGTSIELQVEQTDAAGNTGSANAAFDVLDGGADGV